MIYRGIFIGKWLNWLQKWGINNGKFPISSLVRCCVNAQTILPWKFSICIIYCQLESPQSFFFHTDYSRFYRHKHFLPLPDNVKSGQSQHIIQSAQHWWYKNIQQMQTKQTEGKL